MTLPGNFEEYVKKGTIRKCSINKPRAKFLVDESQKTFNGLKKRLEIMGIDEDNVNSIVILISENWDLRKMIFHFLMI